MQFCQDCARQCRYCLLYTSDAADAGSAETEFEGEDDLEMDDEVDMDLDGGAACKSGAFSVNSFDTR